MFVNVIDFCTFKSTTYTWLRYPKHTLDSLTMCWAKTGETSSSLYKLLSLTGRSPYINTTYYYTHLSPNFTVLIKRQGSPYHIRNI